MTAPEPFSASIGATEAHTYTGVRVSSIIALLTDLEPRQTQYTFWKRVADIAISATLLAAVSPILAGAAIAVKLTSPGPILYRQKRLGEYGEEFEMLKFRSMYINSGSKAHEEAIAAYMAGEKLDNDPNSKSPYKLTKDPRITRVGRFIRKTSIDELPQFWNVLRGDMSLVGPRPPLPYEVERYSLRAMRRLHGMPGITGPWQVYGRNRVTFDEMVNMDLDYLTKRSLWYDLKLIALTPTAAIKGGE
jgi:lipopolysaccharide/colanic/teichoic acid biosynthesis glycosyltransferase